MSNIDSPEKIISSSTIRNTDKKTTSDAPFDLQSTNEVNDFLKAKLEYETYPMRKLEYTKNYIEGSYELLNWKIIDASILWCEIFVDVKYQYSDASIVSGFGETIQVVIENSDNPIIIDFYNGSFESFDSQIRSYELDLTDSKNWLSNQNTNEIISNMNKRLKSHKEAFTNLKQMMIETSQENNTTTYTDVVPLSTRRQNAVNYAVNNYNRTTPSSGGQSVPFYNFNPGCTEFISHCLLAGGFNQVFGQHGYENCWYYRNVNDRSSSWAGVNPLFGWLSWNGNTGSGPKAVSFFTNRNNLVNSWPFDQPLPIHSKNGNIIQIKYNWSGAYGYPNYGHSILVTGYSLESSSSPFLVTPLATWRTNSTSRGLNRKVIDVYPPAPNTTCGSGGHLYRAIDLNY